MTFQVTGQVPIRISRSASNRENELKYQAIGYSIALIIAFILFRGLSSVVIVALAPTFGVFWTLGLLHFIGFDDNPFNSVIVPVLLCMVGFTDGVHMMVQIRRHRASGMSATDAARRSIREVGLACWLTSLTTAIGFGSLALAHHEIGSRIRVLLRDRCADDLRFGHHHHPAGMRKPIGRTESTLVTVVI